MEIVSNSSEFSKLLWQMCYFKSVGDPFDISGVVCRPRVCIGSGALFCRGKNYTV